MAKSEQEPVEQGSVAAEPVAHVGDDPKGMHDSKPKSGVDEAAYPERPYYEAISPQHKAFLEKEYPEQVPAKNKD